MPRRTVWTLLPISIALLLVGLGLGMWRNQRANAIPSGWSSSSIAAVAELELALQAEQKYYGVEAARHFRRALELDSSFVAAKLMLVKYLQGDARAAVRREISATDLSLLNDREVVLARVVRTFGQDGGAEQRAALIDAYLERYPRDPYVLDLLCGRRWERQDWSAAESCYNRLLEVAPNWVAAQNRLAYLAMAQGRFADAERQFRTYRFVAPDQANPHDSLGELLTTVGRYDEAVEAFEEALRLRPDFCASYQHLTDALRYAGRLDDAEAVVERADNESECLAILPALRCQLRMWRVLTQGDWQALEAPEESSCLARDYSFAWIAELAAVLRGDLERAQTIVEEAVARIPESPRAKGTSPPDISHLQGVLAMARGEPDTAVEAFSAADRELNFWGQQAGMFKLYNRLHLANALKAAGRPDDAARLLAEVRSVNPSLAAAYAEGRLPTPQPVDPAVSTAAPSDHRSPSR